MPQLPALPPTAYGTDLTRANFLREHLVEFEAVGKVRGRNDPNQPRRPSVGPARGTSTSLPTDFGRMRGVLRNITRSGAQRAGDLPLFGAGSGTVTNSTRNEAFNVNVINTTLNNRGRIGVEPLDNFDVVSHAHINATTKVRYDKDLSGGEHAHKFNGGVIGKAWTSFIGDKQHDVLLLEQIRHVLIEANGLTCTGGFPDQLQNVASAMFVLARHTPRIWNQFSGAELDKLDRTMTAVLVTGAFVNSDQNPFVLADTQQYDMDGVKTSRTENPNHANASVYSLIYGVLYFGSNRAKQILAQWNQQVFIDQLLGFEMQHIHRTYTSADPNAPTAAQIDTCLHAMPFSYFGVTLDDPLAMWVIATKNLIDKVVDTGLNNGLGELGDSLTGGYMADAAKRATLPNFGRTISMFHEFASTDADGSRSASHYTHDGWYTNLHCHATLVAIGLWEVNDDTQDCLERIKFAVTDWLHKNTALLGGGYTDFYRGNGRGVYLYPSDNDDTGRGHTINFDLQGVLDRWHLRDHGFVVRPDVIVIKQSVRVVPVPQDEPPEEVPDPPTNITLGVSPTQIKISTPTGGIGSEVTRRMGVNLDAAGYFATEIPWKDVFQTSRRWRARCVSSETNTNEPIAKDANGWVTSLNLTDPVCGESQAVQTVMHLTIDGHYPAGEYIILYDGTGTITVQGDASISSQVAGRIVVDVDTPSDLGFAMKVTVINVGDPLTNIRVLLPGTEGTYVAEPWRQGFLDRWPSTHYQVYRFMDWGRTNHSLQTDWADRRPTTYTTQNGTLEDANGGAGVAWEHMIDLCNKQGVDPWFCIPSHATDDYIDSLATLVFANLNTDRKVYLEYSNETWNFTEAREYVRDTGYALGYGNIPKSGGPVLPADADTGNRTNAGIRYHAQRTYEIGQRFETIFGGKTRLVRVLGTQAVNSFFSAVWFGDSAEGAFNQVDFHIDGDTDKASIATGLDVLATTAYFSGVSASTQAQADALKAKSIATIHTDMINSIPGMVTHVLNRKIDAAIAGLQLMAYEGGQSVETTSGSVAQNDDDLTTHLIAVQEDSGMEFVYDQFTTAWNDATDGALMCHFNSTRQHGKFGSWGMLQYFDSSETAQSKYTGMKRYIEGSVV